MCTSLPIPLCSPKDAKLPTALALGSFDGLHDGHRNVIKAITQDHEGVPTVVSFWPHPREVLFGESRLRLDLPSEKLSLLSPLGVKQLVLVPFDRSLASLSAEEFFKKVLLDSLQAKHIAIGQNFRFGRNRKGDSSLIQKLAKEAGIRVTVVPILEDKEGRVSSSRIRLALKGGDLLTAKQLLGRSYSFQGKVIKGKGLGHQLGWPTANLEVDGRKFLPGEGVYAVWAWKPDELIKYAAVMNLGPQPTVDPSLPSSVEVHLLDQVDINLKGSKLIIEPVEKLRTQQKFENFEALSDQIKKDAQKASCILKS